MVLRPFRAWKKALSLKNRSSRVEFPAPGRATPTEKTPAARTLRRYPGESPGTPCGPAGHGSRFNEAPTPSNFFTRVEILIVEDDASTRALLTRLLAVHGHTAVACADAEEAAEAYRRSFYPLVLLDLYLPGMTGFEFCRWLRTQPDGERPYVLVGTASEDPADLHTILEGGADDYLIKPYEPSLFDVRLAVAAQAVKIRAARRQLETELGQERAHLLYVTSHDPLTKLGNRATFTAEVTLAVERAAAGEPHSALLYIDLDNFKIINESLGHAAGDRLLVQIAYLLRNAARPRDSVARFGGDKFVVLQHGVTLGEARLAAERLRSRVTDFVFCDSGKSFGLNVSVGVSELTGETTAEHVIATADAACYAAKARGRNRVEVYQPDDAELARLRSDSHWSSLVQQGLKNNRFEVWFQPVVDLESGRAAFHETHGRLRTADGDVVEPEFFLPAADRFHLRPEIDRHVARLAARHLAADPALRGLVSLSAQSLREVGMAECLRKAFESAGVAPNRVTFGISEAAVTADLDAARRFMERLRKEGFRFALENFGAGLSSLSYLKELAVDLLKIEGSLVRDLAAEPLNLAFVKVINDIARHLRVSSVAEGVDDAVTAEILRQAGVRYAQGVYFNGPVPILRDRREIAAAA